jgi:hypothetical protein
VTIIVEEHPNKKSTEEIKTSVGKIGYATNPEGETKAHSDQG